MISSPPHIRGEFSIMGNTATLRLGTGAPLLGGDAETVMLRGVRRLEVEASGCDGLTRELFEQLPAVEIVSLRGQPVCWRDIVALCWLPNLRILDLTSSRPVDFEFGELASSLPIRELILEDTGVTDEDIERIATLDSLTALRLRKTRLGSRAVAAIARMAGLRELELPSTIGDAEAAHLSSLTELEVLWLRDTRVTESSAQLLKHMSRLKVLSLPATFGPAGFWGLDGRIELMTLWIDSPLTDGQSIYGLRFLPKLDTLYLNAPLSLPLAWALRVCARLRRLAVTHSTVDPLALRLLARTYQLQSLRVAPAFWDRAFLPAVIRLRALKELRIDASRLSADDLLKIRDELWQCDVSHASRIVRDPLVDVFHRHPRSEGSWALSPAFQGMIRVPAEDHVSLRARPGKALNLSGIDDLVAANVVEIMAQEGSVPHGALTPVESFRALWNVDLSGAELEQGALDPFRGKMAPRQLILDDSNVGDEALHSLAGNCGIEVLSFRRTAVGDSGLSVLASMCGLKRVQHGGTPTTPKGIAAMAGKLPGVEFVI